MYFQVITIFKITVEPILENDPKYSEYLKFQEYISDLNYFVALSYRFPQTKIRENPKEVYRNADIDITGDDYDDGDD